MNEILYVIKKIFFFVILVVYLKFKLGIKGFKLFRKKVYFLNFFEDDVFVFME